MAAVKSPKTGGNKKWFTCFAARTAQWAGSPIIFIIACASVAVWAISGPFYGYSDTWQLVINTSTTVITFLMVFLIQNTQSRDTRAMQLKLDELIRALPEAENRMVQLEDMEEEELNALHEHYLSLAGATLEHARMRANK